MRELFLKIPIKKHLAQFALFEERDNLRDGSIILTSIRLIPNFIMCNLKGKLSAGSYKVTDDDMLLPIVLNKHIIVERRFFYGVDEITATNSFLNNLMNMRYEQYVSAHPGRLRKDLMPEFLSKSNIDMDIERFTKANYRYRKLYHIN